MQISSKLSHVVKVNKNNSFPWVSIRSGSRSHPQQHSLRCNHPPTTEVFCSQRFPQKITWDSQAFPLPQKSATDFYPPPRKCYMNHEIHCLIDPESSQEKEAYDLEINWRIDEYRKKHGKNDTTLEGFQGAFPCRPSVSPLKRGYRVFLKGSKRGGYNF